MDPHLSFASRDELWQLQADMKSIHTTQTDHSDRLLRLERRLDEDTRMKSVWGASSPFPSVLSGTPQQDPGYNPAAEAFKSFDQEQNSNLLGSLHLDTEDEPRRGASRANSVRFDETALQGHLSHASRSSSEFFPIRTGSGLGSLPMVERSSSHKSDGRQSSAGHSAHSTRLNSLAFDARSPALENQVNVGPPVALFLLGPLPCIMRCWLDDNFSNEALLYAAICTGSCTSMISSRLAHRYGIIKQSSEGERDRVTLQVFLPEATVQQASPRPLNLIPQVPSISIEFEVFELPENNESLQVIIGSDILRSKSAELSFSQDRMVLFDDERSRLTVPLVRPENSSAFRTLRTIPASTDSSSIEHHDRDVTDSHSGNISPPNDNQSHGQLAEQSASRTDRKSDDQDLKTTVASRAIKQNSITTAELGDSGTRENTALPGPAISRRLEDNQTRESTNGTGSGTPTKETQAGMWGSWRRESNQLPSSDSTFSSVASSSNYQRPGRGKGMKVLKPARTGASRSMSSTQTSSNLSNPSSVDPAPSKWQDLPIRSTGLNAVESSDTRSPDSPRRSFSSEPRAPLGSQSGKSRSANPVGGASAFGWLNSGQK